jgi:hypothetical protein
MPGSPAGDLWMDELHRFPTLLPMATLAVLTAPAALAQDHSGHSAPPTQAPTADPHAGHDMSAMPGMDHGPDHAMTSPLGTWPMSRDASGTSWQPDASEHGGLHVRQGDWSIMSHALINLTYDSQSGPRGDDKTFASESAKIVRCVLCLFFTRLWKPTITKRWFGFRVETLVSKSIK